ncbi:MAG TPA: helix-turn-helix transcriptional regulator [Gemmatimonadales bacterium]|nr:helix-turn-helix transcriptional regulator [Gemmatimonadales bacterium]
MASLNVRFGRTVRALRTGAGYSQESFADALGVHRTYMGTLERGDANPTLEMIARIARGLRLSLTKLFEAVETGQVDAAGAAAAPDSILPPSTKTQRSPERAGAAKLPRVAERPRRGSKDEG